MPGHHERQSSHMIHANRLQSGQQKLGQNKSKKGILQAYPPYQQHQQDQVTLQQNNASTRVQSPIIMNNQKGKKVTPGHLRQSLNNANQNMMNSNSPVMYPENYGNSNFQLLASLVEDGEDLV